MLTFLLHHLQAPAKYLLYQGQYISMIVHLETTWLLHLFFMCTVQKPIKYIYLQLGYMFTIILQAPGKVPLKTKVRIVHLDYTVSFTIFLKLVTFFHSQSSQEANFSCLQYMLTFLLHHLQAPAKYLLYQGQYFHDCSLRDYMATSFVHSATAYQAKVSIFIFS